jgi:hypothetical protein
MPQIETIKQTFLAVITLKRFHFLYLASKWILKEILFLAFIKNVIFLKNGAIISDS